MMYKLTSMKRSDTYLGRKETTRIHGPDRLPMVIAACAAIISILAAPASSASGIDGFSRSVVFLSDNVPVFDTINGTRFEVWLKVPGTTNCFTQKCSKVSGTGLVVVSSNLAYLITAKHVAEAMTEDCQVIMQGDNDEPIEFKISAITGQRGLTWLHDPVADVSVHPLPTITKAGLSALERRAVPVELLESLTNLPPRDVHVTALGFPLALGTQGRFAALSRESKVSSGMLSDASGFFFLLQDPSVSGYSGGPLIESGDPRFLPMPGGFSVVNGGQHCWGFVQGTYGDETGGKMSRIVPAFYAVQLVHKFQSEGSVFQAASPPASSAGQ